MGRCGSGRGRRSCAASALGSRATRLRNARARSGGTHRDLVLDERPHAADDLHARAIVVALEGAGPRGALKAVVQAHARRRRFHRRVAVGRRRGPFAHRRAHAARGARGPRLARAGPHRLRRGLSRSRCHHAAPSIRRRAARATRTVPRNASRRKGFTRVSSPLVA